MTVVFVPQRDLGSFSVKAKRQYLCDTNAEHQLGGGVIQLQGQIVSY